MSEENKPQAPVACDVQVPANFQAVGTFANAFRILKDTGDEFFLDFMVYSSAENKALMVSRIRVTKNMIPALRERFQTLSEELVATQGLGIIVPPKDVQ